MSARPGTVVAIVVAAIAGTGRRFTGGGPVTLPLEGTDTTAIDENALADMADTLAHPADGKIVAKD